MTRLFCLSLVVVLASHVPIQTQEPKPRDTFGDRKDRAVGDGDSLYVWCVAFSPDGKTVASGHAGSKIKLWDVKTGKNTVLEGHTASITYLAFSPDGETLASGSYDWTVKLWDLKTGKNIAIFKNDKERPGQNEIIKGGAVHSVTFSKDGKTLAYGTEGEIRLWDVASGKNTATFQGPGISVAFTPDAKTLAAGTWRGTINLWDVKAGKNTATLTLKENGHGCWVTVAFSPDGKTLAGSVDKVVKLWDVESKKQKAILRDHTDFVSSVAFSPDGKTLASGSRDNTINLWDVATGKLIATLTGHAKVVTSVAFSKDGKTLASGSEDETIKLWDIPVAEAKKVDPPRNKPFTNSIGMKFVWIPPGAFWMGSPQEESGRIDREIENKVKLTKGFYMGVYTVTQEQWKEVMGNNPSFFKGEKNLPVEQVSWDDCQEFIKKLREKDKKLYRLPTEAEWEYACRAGTTTPFHFGETISTDQANYNGTVAYGDGKKGVYREKTTPVGSFPANAWGLHDMHGNVVQWCQDWYGDYLQKNVVVVDPAGAEKGTHRVLHGGSWNNFPRSSRSASRSYTDPYYKGSTFGLRVCFFVE